eukprot:CAMPEP_0174253514 /NCGR_PEP_ID=MMETSP0439-20130205/2875_1 /TAXON_ID=0 /ORGANISM="Stereomyxa ramosa, Strain Chinc5" /LENGTH=312 /DNA_ID=CAMNT_0015334569 /DNA_START=20 /DNA_END=958 /DNA_ORIENTATION=-
MLEGSELTVRDVVGDEPQTISTVSSSDSVAAILDTLFKHHYHSAPVVEDDGNCTGFVDLVGILSFLVRVCGEVKHSKNVPISTDLKHDDMNMLYERAKEFFYAKEDDVATLSKYKLPFLPCTIGAPLKELLKVFAVIPRVPVVSAEDEHTITHICTQSDVIKFLARKPELLGEGTLESLGLVSGNPFCVATDSITIDAYVEMHGKKFDCAGIVGEDGTLVGCLSATDLKHIADYAFSYLLLPVDEFIEGVRKQQDKPKDHLVAVKKDATLGEVVQKLAEEHVHRVFVVDAEGKPIGIVAMTDVARALTKGKK